MITKKFNEWVVENKAVIVYHDLKSSFYSKYFIPNSFRISTILAKYYTCNTYTVLIVSDNVIKLIPGKIFHYENSGWIVTEKCWSDDEIEITLEK